MPETLTPPGTPQGVLDAILSTQAEHVSEHGASLRIQGLAPPQRDCRTCFALLRAVQLARALVEAEAVVPLAASLVPPARRATR